MIIKSRWHDFTRVVTSKMRQRLRFASKYFKRGVRRVLCGNTGNKNANADNCWNWAKLVHRVRYTILFLYIFKMFRNRKSFLMFVVRIPKRHISWWKMPGLTTEKKRRLDSREAWPPHRRPPVSAPGLERLLSWTQTVHHKIGKRRPCLSEG